MKHHLRNRLAAPMMLAMLATWPLDSSATPILSIDPSSQDATIGDSFSLNVSISDVTDLYAYQFDVAFDPSVLTAQNITEGAFLAGGGSTFFIPGSIDNVAGLISFTANSLIAAIPGVDGSGVLAQMGFSAVGAGTSSVHLSGVILQDSTLADIEANTSAGEVHVQGGGVTVSEPTSLWLVAAGIGVLGVRRFRRSTREIERILY